MIKSMGMRQVGYVARMIEMTMAKILGRTSCKKGPSWETQM